jgi:putative tryptophan/tyrosine transport system substrate-binding protein
VIRRREFITLLGGAAATWPLAARAQQSGNVPTIGFLGVSTSAAWTHWTAAFVQRLRELGWIEGRNMAIEYRWAEGRVERSAEIVAEFVHRKVDIIVTAGTAVPAAKQATSTIPIVFALASDPLGSGLVTSLARPGGNVTGLSTQSNDTASKRLEILREVIPGFRRLAVLGNAGYAGSVEEMREVLAVAHTLGLEVDRLEIRRGEDIAPAFEQLKSGVQALYVCTDALANANRHRINILALGARLPTMLGLREYVDPAGLMSYGPHIPDLFRRAAGHVDKILRGAKPGDLPVEQPTKFELIINLTVAKALGLELSEAFLLRADEVIE